MSCGIPRRAAAVDNARRWVGDGLGAGGCDRWLAAIDGAYKRGFREATQDRYYAAKTEITECFARIDTSLEQSVQKLLDRVAAVLRLHLTPTLVPPDSGLAGLGRIAVDRRALRLHAAIEQLGNLTMDYGSIVLRVTRPIIREIDPEDPAAGARSTRAAERAAAGVVDAVVDVAMDTAAAAVGSPVPVSGVARAGYRWVTGSDGVRRREAVPAAPRSTPARPPATVATAAAPAPDTVTVPAPRTDDPRPRQGAEKLFDDLTHSVDTAIDDLERALREEACVMVKALAAAVDKFFDAILRTNDISREYELLCGPDRRTIWPDAFDDGSARLAADLSLIAEHARRVVVQTDAAGGFRMTLRSPHAQGAPR